MALALYGINVYICTSFTFFTNQMSSYIFELNDYHAVKKAEIKIDGITVLAGLNGSGKSTVARWLHHVVKVLNDYDSMVEQEGVNSFMSFLSGMRRAVTSIDETGESRIMNDIYDEAKNIIFKYGNPYQLYIIDGNVLVYDDNWIPYIFYYIEDDMRCVWKFFVYHVRIKLYQTV